MELNLENIAKELRGKAGGLAISASMLSTSALAAIGLTGCSLNPEPTQATASSLDTGFSPNSAEDERRFNVELVPSGDSEALIIDGNSGIHRVTGKDGKEYTIFKDNVYQASADSNNSGQSASFEGHVFYAGPRATVSLSQLEDAYTARKQLETEPGKFEMVIMLPLLTEENRQESANALNHRFPKAGKLTKDDILLAPYRMLEIFGVLDGESVRIATWPKIPAGSNTLDIPDSRPTVIPVQLTGSEEELKRFVENGRIDLKYHLGGFTIKQNTIDVVYEAVMKSDLVHFLNGDAKWSEFSKVKHGSAGGGASLGPFTIGGSKTSVNSSIEKNSYVSRNQVKEIARVACERLKIHKYSEFKNDDDSLNRLLDLVTNKILSKMDQVEIQVKEDGTLMLGNELFRDIAPDVEKTVNQDLKTKTQVNDTKSANVTIGKVTAGGSHSHGYLNDDDYTFGNSGEKIVPKTIKLYQANSASFEIDVKISATEIEATPGYQPFLQTGTVLKITSTPNIPARVELLNFKAKWKVNNLKLRHLGTPLTHGNYRFNTEPPIISLDSKGKLVLLIPYNIQISSHPQFFGGGGGGLGGFGGMDVRPSTNIVDSGTLTVPLTTEGRPISIEKTRGMGVNGSFTSKNGADDKKVLKASKGTAISKFEMQIDTKHPDRCSISGTVEVRVKAETQPEQPGESKIEILPRD